MLQVEVVSVDKEEVVVEVAYLIFSVLGELMIRKLQQLIKAMLVLMKINPSLGIYQRKGRVLQLYQQTPRTRGYQSL